MTKLTLELDLNHRELAQLELVLAQWTTNEKAYVEIVRARKIMDEEARNCSMDRPEDYT